MMIVHRWKGKVDIMEHGPIKKITIIVIIVLALALIGTVSFFILKKDNYEVDFSTNEAKFFYIFGKDYVPNEYTIKSLDAYYLDEGDSTPAGDNTGTYFFHIVYRFYFEHDEKWYDIDEVDYGPYGYIENCYCLSWDDIEGFEEINEKFQQAVKNGVHKSYDVSKFQEYIDKYKD